jgi:hypothetical protein
VVCSIILQVFVQNYNVFINAIKLQQSKKENVKYKLSGIPLESLSEARPEGISKGHWVY